MTVVGAERAVKWEFDATAEIEEWKQGAVIVAIEQKPFASGYSSCIEKSK